MACRQIAGRNLAEPQNPGKTLKPLYFYFPGEVFVVCVCVWLPMHAARLPPEIWRSPNTSVTRISRQFFISRGTLPGCVVSMACRHIAARNPAQPKHVGKTIKPPEFYFPGKSLLKGVWLPRHAARLPPEIWRSPETSVKPRNRQVCIFPGKSSRSWCVGGGRECVLEAI